MMMIPIAQSQNLLMKIILQYQESIWITNNMLFSITIILHYVEELEIVTLKKFRILLKIEAIR
ncbi:unnamed protein product [Paramecium sonneborni]|uniref:Uncharacterized protein n=1 Tax=Paramecium sonneborni TaxID=65129 RepID=A0A8S1QL96_9CILI|nr:unnamed protein product [Paramecium sonneborni]